MSEKKDQYKYYIPCLDEGPEDAEVFESNWPYKDTEEIATDAAEHFFRCRDGWECNWPITFVILDMQDVELDTVEVRIETVPQFIGRSATKKS